MERNQNAIDILRQRIEAGMSASDANFAQSLADQHQRRRVLSDAQWRWVETLAERYSPDREPQVVPAGAPSMPVGNLDVVFGWLDRAGAHGSTRGINFASPEGQVRIVRPGDRSRYVGQQVLFVKIKNVGYIGKVWRGNFYPSRLAPRAAVEIALSILAEVSAGGVEFAAREGRRTGVCVFCARRLTDDRSGHSVDVGYGPVCADRFMLPWGNVSPRVEMQRRIRAASDAAPSTVGDSVHARDAFTLPPGFSGGNIMPTRNTDPVEPAAPIARDPNGPDDEDLLFM